MAKKLSDKEMRDAIREAYRKLGHVDRITISNRVYSETKIRPTWQKVLGVKSRVTDAEWRKWDGERAKITDAGTLEVHAPEVTVEPTWEQVPNSKTKPLVKKDEEIVFLLNACVDWDKFHRLMTLTDMRRLNLLGQDFLAFDVDAIRFGVCGPNGEIVRCDTL